MCATVTMPGEKPVLPENVPMQGSHRFLTVRGQSPMRFDRLRDLSLITGDPARLRGFLASSFYLSIK